MRARLMGLVGLVALAAVACGVAEPGVTATRSRAAGGGGGLIPVDSVPTDNTTGPSDTTPTSTTQRDYPIIDNVVDFGNGGPRHPAYDGFLTAAFGDVQKFWADAFPQTYGKAWTPLSGGIFAAYPNRTTPIPKCGDNESTYDYVAMRGAFYCILGDFMAYDDDKLLPDLVDQLGKEAVAIVLAHEFGHAVQARAGEWEQPGVLKEQQADCFAGAWAAHVASGGSDLIKFDDSAVRAGLIAMIYVRDPIDGQGLSNPAAHGTGFDRVGAFEDGFKGGVARCKTFFTEDRTSKMLQLQFDQANPSGNLPLVDPNPDATNGPSDIVTLIPQSLDKYWTDLTKANKVTFTPPKFSAFAHAGPFPTCSGVKDSAWVNDATYCAADNTIYWDQDTMAQLAVDPGDMSVGYLFSDAYSDAIQTALKGKKTGSDRALTNDCLTGSWAAAIVPPGSAPIVLSAGDLDEAVITAIARSDKNPDQKQLGTAFEKVDAFRKGVLGGLNACTTG